MKINHFYLEENKAEVEKNRYGPFIFWLKKLLDCWYLCTKKESKVEIRYVVTYDNSVRGFKVFHT